MEYPLEEFEGNRHSTTPATTPSTQFYRRERSGGGGKDDDDDDDDKYGDAHTMTMTGQREHGAASSPTIIPNAAHTANQNLPPTDEGRNAWMFCVSAAAFEFFIWGWNNTYGIFQDYYSLHPPFNSSSAAAISTIGTASLGIQYIALILTILFYQRYPEYIVTGMWTSLIICVLALLLSSFSKEIWQMILLQGIIFGLSASMLYSPVMIWLPEWFVTKRGLATGIIFGGSGIGGFAFPLVMGYMLEKLGFRWTLRIWAVVFGVCCAVTLLGMKPRVPIRRPCPGVPRHPWFPRDLSRLRSPVLYGVAAITLIQALGFFPVSLFIPTYTSSLSPATRNALPSRLVLAVFNAASAIFFMIFGRLSDSYPYPYVIMASGVGCAVAAFVFWGFASSLPWIFAFATVFGGFGGAFPGIWPAAGSEIGGTQNHITNIAFGCFTSVEGITSIIGPIIAASLRDSSQIEVTDKVVYGGFGFRTVELFVGSMGVGTMIGGFVLLFFSTSKRKVKE